MQRRPTQTGSIPFGDEDSSDNSWTSRRISFAHTDAKKRKRKRLRRREKSKASSLCDHVLLGLLFTAIAFSIFAITFILIFLCSWIINRHTKIFGKEIFRNGVKLNHKLYQQRYENMPALKNSVELKLADEDRHYLESYGSEIMKRGCSITVFLMDPRLPLQTKSSPWFTLESIAAFLPDACVVIQTARCKIVEEYGISDLDAGIVAFNRIKMAAMPLFLGMIDNGQVRVSFLDHLKYNLKSCDFFNPSPVFMNVNFWIDEFIEDVDSDTVLIVQDDAVLCHSFNIQSWKEYAFVGAPWLKKSGMLEGMCLGMSMKWKSWTLPQKQWQDSLIGGNNKKHPKPDALLNLDFPDVCSGNGEGPLGNGGLSLRSRAWMVNAIETCPHYKWSGIESVHNNYACIVYDKINEDVYFGIVLRGIEAPLPTAFEASLFSLEMMWPEETVKEYGGPSEYWSQKQVAQRLWGDWKHSFALFQGISFHNNHLTMPIGTHKPWWHQPDELLKSAEVNEQCPFLQYLHISQPIVKN